MNFSYKTVESSAKLQRNRIENTLNDDNFDDCAPENQINLYDNTQVEPDEVCSFAQGFHSAILTKSFFAISDSLLQFSNQINLYDQNGKLYRRALSNDAINFVDANPIIVDDFIICLRDFTSIDIHRLVFDLIDYFSSECYTFISEMITRNGIDYIISYIKILENQDILLKCIQILEIFSKNSKSQQKLTNETFLQNFLQICDSLFTDNVYKSIGQMINCCALLLRQIVNIITSNVQANKRPIIDSNLTESELYRLRYQESIIGENKLPDPPQNTTFKFKKIYSVLAKFFLPKPASKNFQPKDYPHSQYQALKSFQLLYFDPYFVRKVLPYVMHFIPSMISVNKVECFRLIVKVYESENATQKLMEKVDILMPWDSIKASLFSEVKEEVLTALLLLQALFHYSPAMIREALKNGVEKPLAFLVQNASFDVKENTLYAIYSWLTCTDVDRDKQFFSNACFTDILFPLLQSPEENLRKQTRDILFLICSLNFKNEEFVNYIRMNLEMYGQEE